MTFGIDPETDMRMVAAAGWLAAILLGLAFRFIRYPCHDKTCEAYHRKHVAAEKAAEERRAVERAQLNNIQQAKETHRRWHSKKQPTPGCRGCEAGDPADFD